MSGILDFVDVRNAAERIYAYAHRTPVMTCSALNKRVGAEVFFKCENFQRSGAFKFRGACNAVYSMEERFLLRGLATHSSGNHGGALALAAKLRGVPVCVVMPTDANVAKRTAVQSYGAQLLECEPGLPAREKMLDAFVERTGAHVVHPYNDLRVMAGQGTVALELCTDIPGLETIVAPIGGGGLLSGTAVAAHGLNPDARIIGIEPMGADDAWRSLQTGTITPVNNPKTIADGLQATIGKLPFSVLQEHKVEIVRVDEPAIVTATRYVWERMKIIVEPSAAIVVAALLDGMLDVSGQRVGVILSGGNIDLDKLPWN